MKLQFENLSETARERLLYLASYLDKLPKRHWDKFDMSTWLLVSGKRGRLINRKIENSGCDLGVLTDKDLMGCGTNACALGWAASLPKFQRIGLTHDLKIDDIGDDGYVTDVTASRFCVNGKPMEPLEAAEAFFDLGYTEAHYLFGGNLEGTPKEWATMCRYFVQTDGHAGQ